MPTISLEWHRVLEMAIGLLLITLSVILNFPVGGFGLCAIPGMLITGLGLAATREGRRVGGQTHRYLDVLPATALNCSDAQRLSSTQSASRFFPIAGLRLWRSAVHQRAGRTRDQPTILQSKATYRN